MIQFVVRSNSQLNCPAVFSRRRLENGDVVEFVYSLTGSWEKGIEAESWCELAAVGEVYEDDDFTVTVIDE